jgi:dihydrofolate synthase / folylpolyglutamate synthase
MKNVEDAYRDALEYLYSFVDFSMQKADTYSPERFKLERMEQLNQSLGLPTAGYPIIHVAGTKGKGSVCILCASALHQAGYKVGLYTSPHLDDYAERIQIDGQFIHHEDLVSMVEAIKPHVAKIPELTTFEITTALAFSYFSQQQVDAAVIEVGLGGRLDATNVVRPIVSVITSISYDHTHLLGNTLSEIAGEKAGIIKPGIPVVSSPQPEEARLVIEKVARERGASLIQVGRDIVYQEGSHSLDGQTLTVCQAGSDHNMPLTLSIPLLGSHQVANAATAYAALQTFRQKALKVSDQSIQAGFSKAFWPGRFEIVQKSPALVLDCAHNRDSALKLKQTVLEYYPGKPVVLVFGASEDKDIQGMFEELLPLVKDLVAVKSFHPRAIDPHKLLEIVRGYSPHVEIIENVSQAVERALQLAGEDGLVLVTGSIFVVAEARKYWETKADIRRY